MDWRAGLSFADEAALLVALRRGSRMPARALPVPTARALVALEASTATPSQAIERLMRDLLVAPARVRRHREWLEAERERLPARARAALGRDGRARSAAPPLRVRWPCVSGRHLGSRAPELARLALLPADSLEAVRRRASGGALGWVLAEMPLRRRVALTGALRPGDDEALLTWIQREGGCASESPHPATVAALRAELLRVAARADDLEALLSHFASTVLAHALGPRYRIEARALAEVLPLGAGRRLLRDHRRATRKAPGEAVADLRHLVERAIEGVDGGLPGPGDAP